MTTFSVMLDWYAPDADVKTLECYECGTPVEVGRRVTRALCPDCRAEAKRESMSRSQRNRGAVQYKFDDPHVDLVYAIIRQALHDKAWMWRAPQDNLCTDKSNLLLAECDPGAFLEDGGADLWLEALGLDLRPSQRQAIREMVPNE